MIRKKPLPIALLLLFAMPVSANVGQGMNDLFNSVGGFSNTTPPGAYKGQTQNVYSGGRFYARTPIKNYQLVSIQPPSMNIGCGGIDITAGSFSHINEAAITSMFQNIGTSLGYAFLLAIKSSMPQMSSLFEYLQDVAAKANAMNINTCQLTKGISLNSGKSLSDNIKAVAGQIEGSAQNIYSDTIQALKRTQNNAVAQNDAINLAISNDQTKKEIYKPGNVIWRALSKTSGLDQQDKEFIMSLTGAIIIDPPSVTASGVSKMGQWRYIESFKPSDLAEFIGYSNVNSGQIKMLSCTIATDPECTNPTLQTVSSPSFRKLVSDKLDDMLNKLNTRTAQNANSLKLMEASSLPIWKMLTTSSLLGSSEMIDKYKDYLAADIAYIYVDQMMGMATEITRNSEVAASPDAREALGKLSAHLNEIKTELHRRRIEQAQTVARQVELERELQLAHQMMISGIPAQAFMSMQFFK